MKNIRVIFGLIIIGVLLCSCSGEERDSKDTTPPVSPVLVPHLGDTGDYPVVYNGFTVTLNEENNGIDAVPDGDWIRVLWQPFVDVDLSHVKVYRFDQFNNNPVLIDSVSASSRQYIDSRNSLNVETVYSYFIDLVDFSGNSTRSDTVSYAILSKPIIISPDHNQTLAPSGIQFKWSASGFASKYRVLVFDETYKYLWHQDYDVAYEEDVMTVPFPVNLAQEQSGKSIIWRVDSFEMNIELDGFMGAESNERVLHIQ